MSSNNTSRTSSRNANNSPATSSARSPSHSSVDMASLLNSLNPAQLKAVEHDPKIPLQILAGPGSGKTKVLTSRIARLILIHKLPPKSICAVTFTNKAANEMRERLTKLLGKEATKALQMGTFHSICAKFLRQHSHQDYLNEHNISITEMFVASVISKAKAKGQSAAMYFEEVAEKERFVKRLRNNPTQTEEKSVERIAAEVFHGYEEVLKRNNALDFDDLLVYGVDLFNKHAESVLWCRHILVDEFQDTNTMQYELMKAIAIKKCVTIVGDPDQSIYGWRSAEVGNLAKMRMDFPGTQQIFLEQNYRSTASILRSSLAIITEDKKRIPKSLHTSHPLGSTPLVREFPDEKQEAAFIAFEIKRVVANMGGTLRWGDFVVLLRFNALSRPIESALQMEGIPCRILGGHKFFERMEVKDILSYLQLVDNPEFDPAFVRAIKVPARGTGDKTLAELSAQAENLKISQLCLVEKIHDNKVPDVKPPVKRKIVSFIKIIRSLRELDKQNTPPSDMIRKLVDVLDYEAYLKKTQQDWESRWENVQELISFASEVEKDISARPAAVAENSTDENTDTPLRQFLQASMLSSEGDNQSEEESKEKVTLSTCHAAKGLEWPVVIIPSADQDTFPFYRSEDLDEERRLLYVACTRAQTLLYLLHATERQVAGKTKKKLLSTFISAVQQKNQGFFSYDIPRFLSQDRDVITGVLSRPPPKESEIERMLTELAASGARVQSAFQGTNSVFSAVSLTGVKMANDEGGIVFIILSRNETQFLTQ
ncbi:P-loop containing nucleoside triphosphate hydrolase protein [Pholiota conissans]|uniref:DNA 3'-5' helicase n=1 Tax=Pholiota conissans TaxID=109636 RepID=A0A9P5ZG01_9AGAR|nr:P-loop containing nucleoside triphosphate hydrolase protein [Pholiota conissans]